VDAIGSLGVALKTCGQYQEAEALLYIFTQLDCELSHDSDRNTIEAQSTVYVMSHLASRLRRQGRYGDSAAVLVATERRFKDLICLENPSGRVYYRQKAKVLKIEGQLLESKEILRGILNHAPDHPTMDKINALASLANILAETGRQEEAATLREKKFFDDVEKYGIAYKLTIESFEELGQCYIELGWYDDAIYLFQQTIEKLALIQGSETDFCNAYTWELRDWILRVEKRRRKAEELELIWCVRS
jgi:tetratricopeptide (TPR) repeat protein